MKKLTIILTVLAAAIVLSACSGVIGGETAVRVSVPQLANDGRHVSTIADEGYVIVMKENKDTIYSANLFEEVEAYEALIGGKAVIANLPVGDYIFGVALMNTDTSPDENVGFAVKKYTVRRGINDLVIDVAPGITTCQIERLSGLDDIDNLLDPPDWINSISFAENTVTIDYDRPTGGTTVNFSVAFGDGTNATVQSATIIGGSGGTFSGSLPEEAEGIEFLYYSSALDRYYIYRLFLK